MSESLKLRDQTGFPFYLCAKELYNRYTSLLEPFGLTYTQLIVLMYLWEIGESNIREASGALLLDPSTLTPLLKRLESKGYVSRRRDPDDERNILIRPTDKGRTLKNEVSAVREHANDVLGLSGSEMETLRSIILKALDNIERNRKNGSN